MRLILIAAFCLAAAACSRGDDDRLKADANATGHDAVVSVRKGAAEAEAKTGQALIDAGAETKRAAEQARARQQRPLAELRDIPSPLVGEGPLKPPCGLLHLRHRAIALQAGQVVDEEDPVEVVHLVLDADGEEALGVLLDRLRRVVR